MPSPILPRRAESHNSLDVVCCSTGCLSPVQIMGQGIINRAAESFSRPRDKTAKQGPLREKRGENFSITPFRLA